MNPALALAIAFIAAGALLLAALKVRGRCWYCGATYSNTVAVWRHIRKAHWT